MEASTVNDTNPFQEFVEEYCRFRKLFVRWVPFKKPARSAPKGRWVKCAESHPKASFDYNEAMFRIVDAVKARDPLFVAYHFREYDLDAADVLVDGDQEP
jgi:hypothetical protein